MSVAVVTFPGSNCDRDVVRAVAEGLSGVATRAWHKDAELPVGTTAVVLPGGFSYGDYLRCGAMASLSPVMGAVRRFIDAGGPVLGICNGFQILCESKLLPGALLRNKDGLFHCEDVELEVSAGGKGLLYGYDRKQRITLPIAHGEGNYFADDATLDLLEREDRIAFRYTTDVNGSRRHIAGVIGGPKRNVVGLMPHPERRSGDTLGGSDGLPIFRALLSTHVPRGCRMTPSTSADKPKDLMGLTDDEYARAVEILGRTPNLVELGCFAAMWSEHCSYKSSRVHLSNLPTTGPRVLVGPGENAGVVDVGEGWAVAFKVESHNHPSYIEPYQGAATGVGGILRDVFTMGARPIAAMNLLRFGRPSHPKTPSLLSGVVRGIGGYGNCFGVPTVYASADFDAAYDGNILVNAFALGVLRADKIFKGTASGVGNPVMYVGAKTGRDGIHGATMASDAFSEEKETERPTVQVGDPFKEKLLMEACQECFQTDCLVGIQDMGAAGLTSSTFEMASRAGSGVRIDLDKVPARETRMSAYELMLSESQERMLLVAKRGREDEVKKIFARWDLDCVEIGTVTDDGRVRLFKDGAPAGDLPAKELADEAPRYKRPFVKPPALAALDEGALRKQPLKDALRALVLSPTLAPKTWIYRRYDREVGAGTLLDGTQAAAALVRLPGTERAVAMALVCDGRLCASDPREGAKRAVVEGVMRTSAVGASPLGTTDCLNYGNPQKPEIMGQIVEGIAGIREACLALDAPVVSGNVSLYNQTDDRAVHPTPTIGVVGLVERFADVVPRAAVVDGDVVIRLGAPPTTLAGALALSVAHGGAPAGTPRSVDLTSIKVSCDLVRALVRARLVKDARPTVAGGLAATLFELVLVHGRGTFAALPAGEDPWVALFGEDSPGFVAVVPAGKLDDVALKAAQAGVPCEVLGGIGGHSLTLSGKDGVLCELDAGALVQEAEGVIPTILAGEAR